MTKYEYIEKVEEHFADHCLSCDDKECFEAQKELINKLVTGYSETHLK